MLRLAGAMTAINMTLLQHMLACMSKCFISLGDVLAVRFYAGMSVGGLLASLRSARLGILLTRVHDAESDRAGEARSWSMWP